MRERRHPTGLWFPHGVAPVKRQTRYESSVIHTPCPRGCMGDIQITTEVGEGRTTITKVCASCGQFIGETTLPVEQHERLMRVMR